MDPLDDTTKFNDENSFLIGGIQCWDSGTVEVFSRYNTRATRTLQCRWGDRLRLINTLNPGATDVTGSLGITSMAYPDLALLFPQEFRVSGMGVIGPSPTQPNFCAYQYAQIECDYMPYNAGDLSIDVGANVLTLPRSGPCLETDEDKPMDIPFQDSAGKPIAVIGLTQGENNVPVLPMAAIVNCAKNPLNDSTFFGNDPGTVMFQGGRARKLSLVGGGPGAGGDKLQGPFDVEYRFLARPELAWDKLPIRQPDGTFVFKKVRFKNKAGPYLGRSNFDALFTQY